MDEEQFIEEQQGHTALWIGGILVSLIVGLAGGYYFGERTGNLQGFQAGMDQAPQMELTQDALDTVEETSVAPLDGIVTNPFEDLSPNPLEDVSSNPYDDADYNPFE